MSTDMTDRAGTHAPATPADLRAQAWALLDQANELDENDRERDRDSKGRTLTDWAELFRRAADACDDETYGGGGLAAMAEELEAEGYGSHANVATEVMIAEQSAVRQLEHGLGLLEKLMEAICPTERTMHAWPFEPLWNELEAIKHNMDAALGLLTGATAAQPCGPEPACRGIDTSGPADR